VEEEAQALDCWEGGWPGWQVAEDGVSNGSIGVLVAVLVIFDGSWKLKKAGLLEECLLVVVCRWLTLREFLSSEQLVKLTF